MPRKKDTKITAQEILFCHRYVLTNKVAQSVRYVWPSVTSDYSHTKGLRLLDKKPVIDYIAELRKYIAGSKEDVADIAKKVLSELELVGFSDIRKFFKPDSPEGKFLREIGEEARAISQIEIDSTVFYKDGKLEHEDKKVKLKLHNKLEALELRGKNLKLYTDAVQSSISPKTEVYVPANGRNRITVSVSVENEDK